METSGVTPRGAVAAPELAAVFEREGPFVTVYLATEAAIENASGQSFDAYMRENIWLPAGMRDTRMDDVRSLVPNRVRGYDLADGEIKNAPFIDVSSRFGGGGATGTVPDLLRWARAAFAGKIVSPKWIDEMLRPFTSKSGRFTGLGEKDEAFSWLDRALAVRDAHLGLVGAEPAFDPLRSDARFAALLRRLNLMP